MSGDSVLTISPEDQERLDKARKKRLAIAAEKKSQKKEEESLEDSREEFRKYFVKLKKKLNLNKSVEEVMWAHFRSAGFDKKEKFDEGCRHFGYNI